MAEPIPLNDKMARVGAEVNQRVRPLLDSIAKRVGAVVGAVRGRAESAKPDGVNGYASTSKQ
jgi:hypothetical protein